MVEQQDNIVQMKNIYKNFGGVKALNNVSFSAKSGEIHALMGENGAGKSTLIKILSGAYSKDSGEIYINGRKVNITSPKSGHENGISVIYQEFALAQDLTVAENIYIDHLSSTGGIVNWKELCLNAKKLLEKLDFGNIKVMKPVSELSVGYQQVVEICKALSRKSSVLIFDEPTAVLTSKEVKKLFKIIKSLRDQGVCIIYISHRLEEIFELCDRITVLKDGENVDTVNVKDINEEKLVNMMIGRDINEFIPPRDAKIGDVVLKAENIVAGKEVNDVSLEVRRGEVLGLSGLVGAGRTETMRAIFGADKKENGKVYMHDKLLKINKPKHSVRNKIGMLPEDRKNQGVLLDMSVKVNATLSAINRFKQIGGWINKSKEVDCVKDLVKQLACKTPSIDTSVCELSGGNQQKVALMKWLALECEVLIFDEPTRGVDVGAKIEIYKIMNKLAEQGVAIIMISSEMTEIIGMSDRVIVMREGRITGELNKDNLNEENLIRLSMGVS